MPAYPCLKCGAPVDTSGDGVCKKCHEHKPFKCTKCERAMDLFSVYAPEKLTFRKPIYCEKCGPTTELVDCRQCAISLTRSNAVEVRIRGQEAFYHPECHARQTRVFRTVRAMAMAAGVLICGYFGYMLGHNWWLALLLSLPGIPLGLLLARPFAPN